MITLEQIRDEVIKIGNASPNRTYKGLPKNTDLKNGWCSYVDSEDCPGIGCIFGVALKNLGVSNEQLIEYSQADLRISSILRRMELDKVNHVLFNKLVEVQYNQDDGHSWGEIIKTLQ